MPADKTDVHRTRVKNKDIMNFDIRQSVVRCDKVVLGCLQRDMMITLSLTIENDICPVMEYFEIFMNRMIMCRKAAASLDCKFSLQINGAVLL